MRALQGDLVSSCREIGCSNIFFIMMQTAAVYERVGVP
jgi:hypothetical protein